MGSSLQKIESRVEKGAVMIKHVLSQWLACLQSDVLFSNMISAEEFPSESVINKPKSSCHLKEWLDCCMDDCSFYKYGSDIGLERLSLQSKIISVNIRISL